MGRRFQAGLVIALLVLLFVGGNMLAGSLVHGARIDATQGSLYTLTTGSRNIARSPAEPVTLRFYYSAKLAQGRPGIETYARRVRELLEEFQRTAGGKIRLEIIDPEPFSEAEDQAVQAGLQGVPVNASGDNLYFGLVGTNTIDTREKIAFFDPDKERFLEYDLARLIHSLANPKRKVVGLISSLQIEGGFTMDQRTRQPRQTPPWTIAGEIKGVYDLRDLGQPAEIPKDIDVLMVVHPKNLPETTLYAIDQFVLGGGRLLAFVDPNCENDEGAGQFGAGDRSSSLAGLLDTWGVEIAPASVVADADLAMRVYTNDQGRQEPMPYLVWLGLTDKVMAHDDAVTGQLSRVHVATAGAIRAKAPAKDAPATPRVAIAPLMHSSATAMLMPVSALTFPPDPRQLLKAYTPGKEELTIAARLSGKVATSFPDGRPKGDKEPDAKAPESPGLKESNGPINVILVADCDILADGLWVREENFFGQRVARVMADNADFTLSALENLMGGSDLISVRSRREVARPFTLVDKMQRRAEQQNQAEQEVLKTKLQQAQEKINQLQQQRGDAGALVLTPDQQKVVDDLRTEVLQTRKQLREVQRGLRDDIDRLGAQLKFINIGLMPILVTLGAVGLGLFRRARRRTTST